MAGLNSDCRACPVNQPFPNHEVRHLLAKVDDLLSSMRFFEQPAILIEAGRTEVVSRVLLRCVAALATLDKQLLQCVLLRCRLVHLHCA